MALTIIPPPISRYHLRLPDGAVLYVFGELICIKFGIPHSYLMIVTNKPESKMPTHQIHGLVKLQDLAKI